MTPTNPTTDELAPASDDALTRIEGGIANDRGCIPPTPIEKHLPQLPDLGKIVINM